MTEMDGAIDSAICKWPHKIEYLSETVAKNAAWLHTMASIGQACKTIEAYACGDHWHIGHPDHRDADHCKANLRKKAPRFAAMASRKSKRRRAALEAGDD